jgi:hypothetical protein
VQRYSSQRAVRLNFSYSNSEIKLESKEAIEKVVPASDPLEDAQPASGFYQAQGCRSRQPGIIRWSYWMMGWITSKRLPQGSAKNATRRPIEGTSCG